MKRAFLLFLFYLAVILPLTAKAQDRGAISLFGGYSRAQAAFDGAHGLNASIAGNVTNNLDLVADFSLFSNSNTFNWGSNKFTHYGFLFGPRVHTNSKQFTPFFHTLIGRYWQNRTISDSFRGEESSSNNKLTVFLGGGIDIRAKKRVSVRVFQLDVAGIRNAGSWSGFVRASFGAVFHLNKVSNNR